ncbi:hypothetical protein V8G54_005194 [Vigna mungo]|uniref:Uncharacterized protein n=1 Tax=Vigna mungo TaxID=3915 RepID=A0AAQ3PGB7_VIGMU
MQTGQLPSRGKLYIETHKIKDGSFINDAAKDIAEQIEVGFTQSTTNESEVSPDDVVDLSLASSTIAPSSSSNEWKQKDNNLESTLKAYMIMKEGKIPNEFTSFFDSQPQEGGDANESESPLGGTIGSSGHMSLGNPFFRRLTEGLNSVRNSFVGSHYRRIMSFGNYRRTLLG